MGSGRKNLSWVKARGTTSRCRKSLAAKILILDIKKAISPASLTEASAKQGGSHRQAGPPLLIRQVLFEGTSATRSTMTMMALPNG